LNNAEELKAGIRAKVEHPFLVIKRQFGYMKTRYQGLTKTAAQNATLFALSNLWMARHDLMAARAMFDPVSVRQAWQRARKEASTLDAVLVAQSCKSLDVVLSKLGDAFHYPVCRLNSELALLPDLAMLGLTKRLPKSPAPMDWRSVWSTRTRC
jgi:IS5 family transposase